MSVRTSLSWPSVRSFLPMGRPAGFRLDSGIQVNDLARALGHTCGHALQVGVGQPEALRVTVLLSMRAPWHCSRQRQAGGDCRLHGRSGRRAALRLVVVDL